MRLGFNGEFTRQRSAIAFLVASIAALALQRFVPALIWILPPIFVLVCLATELRQTIARERRIVLGLCALVFFAHAACLVGQLGYNPAHFTTWYDDREYLAQSAALAHAWKLHLYPDIRLKGSELYYMGTLHTGYQRALAAIYYCFGARPPAGLLLNVFSGALIPAMMFLLVKALVTPAPASATTEPAGNQSSPVVAAALAAFHPTQYYWGSFLLKDLYLAAWFVAGLWLLVRSIRERDIAAAIAFAAVLSVLFSIRIYCAASLVFAGLVYAIAQLPRRIAWIAFGSITLLLWMLATYTDTGSTRFEQMWSSLVELGPRHLESSGEMINFVLAGIPRLVLGPFSWLQGRGAHPLYGMYPGMWYLYLLVYPLAIAGFVYVVRKNVRIWALPIMSIVGGALVLLTASYAGDAPRQRYYMEYVPVALASYGWSLPKRRIFLLWYLVLFGYIVGQVITVRVRGL